MTITFDLYQTMAVAVVALLVGEWLKRRVRMLTQFCIPSPVIGGIIFSIISLIGYSMNLFECKFDEIMKEVLMVVFFASVGFEANLKTLRKGGKPLVILVVLVAVVIVLQNAAAVGTALLLGLDGLTGMTTGSIPMTGGHGTSGAFGPLLESMGVTGATTLATAAATFGLVAGSLIGGPIARRRIEKMRLLETTPVEVDELAEKNEKDHKGVSITLATFHLVIAMGLGTLVSKLLTLTGLTFPIYIGSMIVAAVIRNIGEYTNRISVPMHYINEIGGTCLSLFLGIAMISLRLWELAELALPLVVMLAVQLVLMIFYANYVVFNLMGKDYHAAVITAGFCGFGMGATPNAMANMQAICLNYRHSVKAFILVPIVGTMFTDFINSVVITFFINLL